MNELYYSLEPSLRFLNDYAERARLLMQEVEEDFFDHREWAEDPEAWQYLTHEFPRAAAKAGAVSDALQEIRELLSDINATIREHMTPPVDGVSQRPTSAWEGTYNIPLRDKRKPNQKKGGV